MPSYEPVIKNGSSGAIIFTGLLDMAVVGSFKDNPTIAPGDFKLSIDGGAFTNLTNLPTVTPAGGAQVRFILTQAETNGDILTIQCKDQAPKEWCDLFIYINTAAGQFDTLQADADDMQTRLPTALVGGRIDASIGGLQTTTRLGYSVPAMGRAAAGAGATTTNVPSVGCDPAAAVADQFKDRTIIFEATTATLGLRGVAKSIIASSNAASPILTVSPALPVAPAVGDTFLII